MTVTQGIYVAPMKRVKFLSIIFLLFHFSASAQADTLRIMSYNVLYYGTEPSCQGPVQNYHQYLKTIVDYAQPDLLCLVKVGAIKPSATGFGNAPYGFADSVLKYALNADSDKFACCTVTNSSLADNQCVLFYNKNLLGFAGIAASFHYITDFNVYKLYYKDPYLAATGDTTFLYVIPNHTQSGGGNEAFRAYQVNGYLNKLHALFSSLPNVISLGDFNVRKSDEDCYQYLVNPVSAEFQFHDPPYDPDGILNYPSDWSGDESDFPLYLTTSTRQFDTMPNSCGTGGGAKGWYDHILLSTPLINNSDHIQYIPGSYITIGNDGNRIGVSVNTGSNPSAPAPVIAALYQMSNKYPVMATLLLSPNPTQISRLKQTEKVWVNNPVGEFATIHLPEKMNGSMVRIIFRDMAGQIVFQSLTMASTEIFVPLQGPAGSYLLEVRDNNGIVGTALIEKT